MKKFKDVLSTTIEVLETIFMSVCSASFIFLGTVIIFWVMFSSYDSGYIITIPLWVRIIIFIGFITLWFIAITCEYRGRRSYTICAKSEPEPAYILTANNFKATIAFQLYNQCPARKPRNFDIIMDKIEEVIQRDFKHLGADMGDFMFKEFNNQSDKTLREYINDTLMSIPEFEDLNLSQEEVDNGVKLTDERELYSFHSGYDVYGVDYWKTDFVDLDAFIGNVYRLLLKFKD